MVERSPRYGIVLNFLTKKGGAKWTEIKATLEAQAGHTIPSPTATAVISTLVKTGFISKDGGQYCINDPLLITAIEEEPLPEK